VVSLSKKLKKNIRIPNDAIIGRLSNLIDLDVKAFSRATEYTEEEILYGFIQAIQIKLLKFRYSNNIQHSRQN